MPTGISINIGVNRVNYHNLEELFAAENDARAMADLANSRGFQTPVVLLTETATSNNVIQAIKNAAHTLKDGDILFLSFSGHGGWVRDPSVGSMRPKDEADMMDETWFLYDRQLLDDELFKLWSEFKSGVRIFVLSDSCHSGTIISFLEAEMLLRENAANLKLSDYRIKTFPEEVLIDIYLKNKPLYDEIQSSHPNGDFVKIEASVLLISACQDSELTIEIDGEKNGLFTQKVLEIWKEGEFGNYLEFHEKIYKSLASLQRPNYHKIGVPSAVFEMQRPLTI